MVKKNYSYIKPGYIFPVSNIKCTSEEYERRDEPTASKQNGTLRHYVMVECPFCGIEFEGRVDRLEFNPEKQPGPRTLCCKKCSLTHKRPFEDPWRSSEGNHAAKNGINISRTENLEGQIFGELVIGPAKDGYTDKFGLAWWPYKCSCGRYGFKRGNTLHKNKNFACERCLGSMSMDERATADWLELHNIKYETHVKFDKLYGTGGGQLSYDFIIRNKEKQIIYAIENQGKQHYEPIDFFGGEEQFKKQQIHDNLKREYCSTHNIKLIEIPYNYNTLDEYLNQILVN